MTTKKEFIEKSEICDLNSFCIFCTER